MKACKNCLMEKPAGGLNRNKRKADGLQTYCRDCCKELNNASYKSSAKRRDKIRENNQTAKERSKKFIRRYKLACGCRSCGEGVPEALDFHHIDPKAKEGNIAWYLTYSLKRLKGELRKCVVLCANCHRKLHAGVLEIDGVPAPTVEY